MQIILFSCDHEKSLYQGELFLSDYQKDWSEKFKSGSQRLQSLVGKYIINLHHIGSTAIINLPAKPIIDILIEVHLLKDETGFIPILENAGYQYLKKWNNIMPFRRLIIRHLNDNHKDRVIEHIHIVEQNHKFVEKHLLFRDFLILNLDEKIAYANLKQKLISEEIPRKDYSDAKSEFINKIVTIAYLQKYGKYPPENYFDYN